MSWRRGRWLLAGAACVALAAAALLAVRQSPAGPGGPAPALDSSTQASLPITPSSSLRFLSYRFPPTQTPAAERPAFIWPVDGEVTQGFWEKHAAGIDIDAAVGDPVRAVRDGRVVFTGGDPCCGYGLFIIIEHDAGWSSLYAHLSEAQVQAGDEVAQGDVIGLAGATGTVTGPHLHFELRLRGEPVDPLLYLPPGRAAPPVELLDADPTPLAPTPGHTSTPTARPTRTPTATPEPSPIGEPVTATPEPSPIGEPVRATPEPSPIGEPVTATPEPSPIGEPVTATPYTPTPE